MTIIGSQRLHLVPLTAEALAALIQGDRAAAERALNGKFPSPELVPPLMTDALDFFLEIAAAGPASAAWGARAYITVDTRDIVGMGGFTGPPDERGFVTMGYSIFPAFQRLRYASEAARALADWALTQPGVMGIQATISPHNVASERVAAYAGLYRTDATEDDPDEGPVVVWQRTQDRA
ncbi:MAG: GNAT family N-acetyltransferase [Chloroflexota bacterium]|nr:GNAT family N-acetyltransferase [Chloroflexota bacterium]